MKRRKASLIQPQAWYHRLRNLPPLCLLIFQTSAAAAGKHGMIPHRALDLLVAGTKVGRWQQKDHGKYYMQAAFLHGTTKSWARRTVSFKFERAIHSDIRQISKEEHKFLHENLGQETAHIRIIESWKKRLRSFAKNEEEKEIVSRDSYDIKIFKYIQILAGNLGLYSGMSGASVVISKVHLPTDKANLHEKRLQRLVCIPTSVQEKVAYYLNNLKDFPVDVGKFSSPSVEIDNHLCSQIATAEKDIMWGREVTSQKLELGHESCSSSDESVLKMQRSSRLREKQRIWQNSFAGQRILQIRKSLPSYGVRETFLQALSQHQVLVVTGETGCGKTTQLPQYILESEIEAGREVSCNIICTQPRRMPVLSVAERVAAERGEDVGDSVGYKVRFEGMRGANTRLLYCTSGVLLRRLMVDPLLTGVTHVILDEIHERGMIEDFLLVVLKDLLPRCTNLKLVLMSATLNVELFSSYFDGAPIQRIRGLAYSVEAYFLEDVFEMLGYKPNKLLEYVQSRERKIENQYHKTSVSTELHNLVKDTFRSSNYMTLKQTTQGCELNWSGPEFRLIEALLEHICSNEKEGAILVFMTGWEEIYGLMKQLKSHSILGDSRKVLLVGCHGGMTMTEQKLVFEHPPPNVRKVILATNVAETSVTIDDIVFVLDLGKAKETSYDVHNDTPYLLPRWISKSSVLQRRGRAGRVRPGICYHLYPRYVYNQLPEDQQPELLRTPIHSICLQVKSMKLGNIVQFLSKALQPPEILAVTKAVEFLQTIGALDEFEELTDLGQHLSVLPVEPRIGKMLIMGSVFHCLNPVLTIAAGLSVRNPFLKPLDQRELAEEARLKFSGDSFSDHLALLHAYECWDSAMKENRARAFCLENFLSMQSLLAMRSLRKQYLELLKDLGFVQNHLRTLNEHSNDTALLRAIISAGLYPGVLSVTKDAVSCNFKTVEDEEVQIHASSVNARNKMGIRFPWLVFNEKVKTSHLFIRDATGISDSMLLLFGGRLTFGNEPGHLFMDKSGLEFFMHCDLANLYVRLRSTLDGLLQKKFESPSLNIYSECGPLLMALQHVLHGDHCEGSFVSGCIDLNKVNDLVALKNFETSSNAKNDLREQLQKEGIQIRPFLNTSIIKGPENDRQFVSILQVRDLRFVGEPAKSKKEAERRVCADAVRWLRDPSNSREKNKKFWGSMKPRTETKC